MCTATGKTARRTVLLVGPRPPPWRVPASQVWDLRKDDEPSLQLKGHSDTVTGLRLSPDGSHLLSNSMDNTLREWDVRPYAPPNRCTKVFTGEGRPTGKGTW